MIDIEIKEEPASGEGGEHLIGIIENQLGVIVTISEMDGELYDDLADDRIKTMAGAFKLIREAQRKLLEDVKNMGKG